MRSHLEKNSYVMNLTAEFGTILAQFAPLPLNIPLNPSVFAMWIRP